MATASQAGAECRSETGRFVGPEPVACGGFACKDQGGRIGLSGGAFERVETEEKLLTAGVDAVVSPSRIGGLRMASEMIRPKVVSFLDSMLRDQENGLRVEEVTVQAGTSAVGKTLESLGIGEMPGTLLVALRSTASGRYQFKPSATTTLESGMTLVVMTDVAGRSRLEKLLKGARFSRA